MTWAVLPRRCPAVAGHRVRAWALSDTGPVQDRTGPPELQGVPEAPGGFSATGEGALMSVQGTCDLRR